jgi:hypothetical protein
MPLLTLLASIVIAQSGGLSEAERSGLKDALFLGNMTFQDLQFERKPFSDPLRLSLVDICLDDPIVGADRLLSLHAATGASPAQDLRAAMRLLGAVGKRSSGQANAVKARAEEGLGLPPAIRERVVALAEGVALASLEVKLAIADLTSVEQRELIEGLPRLAVEEKTIRFDFERGQPGEPDHKRIKALATRVDLVRIRKAALALFDLCSGMTLDLKRLGQQVGWKGLFRGRIAGIQVEVGGIGPDIHDSRDAALMLDLGGNDVYRGRFGAGAGYAGAMIDCAGDDFYELTDLSLGAGVLGIGIAIEGGGNDVVRSKSLCLGAGLAGVGIYADLEGYDTYRSLALAQGFGQFGIGLMWDKSGKDSYDAALYAQGAARTQGVGWLIDGGGNDSYRCGGLVPNAPLFSGVNYSYGQGFGSGYREDTGGVSGGVGLLTDLAGDDSYVAETYAQAASYWFSLGSLFDRSGNDTYSAYHYAQASAMHCTAAYLFDLAGDDGYIAKVGASHAIGHDYGVAFLLDRAGNDSYAGRDSRPGTGNANGVGIFIDADGLDRYFGPPGVGNPARGSGSLGIFADLGGEDIYSSGLSDQTATVKEAWAVALDVSRKEPEEETGDPVLPVKVGSRPKPDDAELESLYKKGTQWGVGSAQAEVERSVRRLQEIGLPALGWMVKNHLGKADRLQLRLFTAMVGVLGLEARVLVASKIASENLDEARNALRIATDAKVIEAGPAIVKALDRAELARFASQAAGSCGATEAVPILLEKVASDDKVLALSALVSLGQLKSEMAIPTAEALLLSGDLTIRKAASNVLASFPPQARAAGRRLLDLGDERSTRIGIELLAKVADEETLERLASLLKDKRSGVKIGAMVALNGRVPISVRPELAALAKDPDPLVRAVASRIDPGR